MINFKLVSKKAKLNEYFDDFEINERQDLDPNGEINLLTAQLFINGESVTKYHIDLFSLLFLFDYRCVSGKVVQYHEVKKSMITENYVKIEGENKTELINSETGVIGQIGGIGEHFTKLVDGYILFYLPKNDLRLINDNVKKYFFKEKIASEFYYVLKLSHQAVKDQIMSLYKELKNMEKENVLFYNRIDLNINNGFKNCYFIRN